MVFFAVILLVIVCTGMALYGTRLVEAEPGSIPQPHWRALAFTYFVNIGIGLAALMALRGARWGSYVDWLVIAWILGSCLTAAVALLASVGRALSPRKATVDTQGEA